MSRIPGGGLNEDFHDGVGLAPVSRPLLKLLQISQNTICSVGTPVGGLKVLQISHDVNFSVRHVCILFYY